MRKDRVIAKILAEVEDKSLRDKLLNAVADTHDGRVAEMDGSLVERELRALGLDPEAVRESLQQGIRVSVGVGYVMAVLALVVCVGGLLVNLVLLNYTGLAFFSLLTVGAIYMLRQARANSRLIDRRVKRTPP